MPITSTSKAHHSAIGEMKFTMGRVSLWASSFALRPGERMIRAIGFVLLFPLRCCCHDCCYFHLFFHSRFHCWCANVWLFVQELNTLSKRWLRVKENKLRDRRR